MVLLVRRGPARRAAVLVMVMVILAALGFSSPSLGVAAGSSLVASPYQELWRGTIPEVDVALRVEPVPGGPGAADRVAVLGRSYETNEVRLYLLEWRGSRLETAWVSTNLFERASPVALAAGDFRGQGRGELAVVTRSTVRLFAGPADGDDVPPVLEEVWAGANPVDTVLEAVAARFRAGEPHRLGLTRVRSVEEGLPHKEILWFRWWNGRWRRSGLPLAVGSLRAVVSGVFTGGEGDDLIVERGAGTDSGWVDLWEGNGLRYKRRLSQTLRPAAIFALGAGTVDGSPEMWLAVGDNRGRVGLYAWEGEAGFSPWGEPVPVGWGLTDLTLADVTGDGTKEMVVLGYPNRVHVVAVSLPR